MTGGDSRRLIRAAATPLLLALAAALFVLPAVASAPDEAETGQPLFMWQVRSETATISLVGSIHVGRPDFFPLPEPFETAFAAANILAVEVDAASPGNQLKAAMIVAEQGMLPEGETLQDRFEPAVWERLEAYAAASGTPLAMYSGMKPGIVAMIVVMLEYQRQGLDAELGIDRYFLDAAREAGKDIRELETLQDQLDLFFGIDDVLDDIMMTEMLDQLPELKTMTEELIDLWRKGDVDGLSVLLQEQMGEGPEMEAFYQRIMIDRNVAMAEKIDGWVQGGEDIFVVVGAGHFAGEQGIVQLLRDKGREVIQARQNAPVGRGVQVD